MKKLIDKVTLAMVTSLLVSCASVTVQKVPTPMQYSQWSDRQQQAADSMEGFRFYLPRPYVNVFQSFPLAADLYIAEGEISPDGQFVVIQNIKALSPLGRFFNSPDKNGIVPGVSFPSEKIGAATPADVELIRNLSSLGSKLAKPNAGHGEPTPVDTPKPAASAATPASSTPPNLGKDPNSKGGSLPARASVNGTGKNSRKVTNDNGAFAFQPLRGSLDIIYLPDFDEQYVVSSKAGLGNAKFDLGLGQGWSLQGFDSLADNAQLNALMYELIGTAAEAAKALASQGTSLGVDAIATAATRLATPHKGGIGERDTPGTKVSLRISVVYYAAKGLYPVIKPRELKDQARSAFILDLADKSKLGERIRAIDDLALRDELGRADVNSGRFTIPVYPYQYLSFNTFRYMSVDVLTKNGLPFGSLYPEVGTVATGGSSTSTIPSVLSSSGLDVKGVRDFLLSKVNDVKSAVVAALSKDNALKSLMIDSVVLELASIGSGGLVPVVKATTFVKALPSSLPPTLKSIVETTVKDKLASYADTKIPGEFAVEAEFQDKK